MTEVFNAVQLATEAKVSYRQLDYWIRKGWIGGAGRGSGRPRRFTQADVDRAVMMGRLVAAGLTPEKAAEIHVELLEKARVRLGPALWLDDMSQGWEAEP